MIALAVCAMVEATSGDCSIASIVLSTFRNSDRRGLDTTASPRFYPHRDPAAPTADPRSKPLNPGIARKQPELLFPLLLHLVLPPQLIPVFLPLLPLGRLPGLPPALKELHQCGPFRS